MQKSYLEFGCHVEDLIFKGLSVSSVPGMIGLCLTVAVFTFSYEGVKTLRQKFSSILKRRNEALGRNYDSELRSESSMLVEMNSSNSEKWKRWKIHFIQAFLYTTQVTMGYILMLVVMSYNAWLAITVFLTAGLSYYFFSTFILSRPTVIPIEILMPDDSS